MSRSGRNTLTIAALLMGYTGFLVWLYYPALQLFFASDDWVFLNFIRRIRWQEPWMYFTPRAIWYYRPLHTLQFGITYNLVGLNQFWYNLQSLVMVLMTVVLGFGFVRELFGVRLALLAAVLFSVSPMAPDVLIWKSNFNTIHYAMVALLAGICFVRYLRSGRRGWFVATLGFAVLGWFTKESVVNLPFVLVAIWFTCYLQVRWEGKEYRRIKSALEHMGGKWPVRAVFWDLLPFAITTLLYGGLRVWLFENVDPRRAPLNELASPLGMVQNLFAMVSYGLYGFLYDPLLLWRFVWVQEFIIFLVLKSMLLPVLTVGVACWKRNIPVLFAVTFVTASIIPTFVLMEFGQSRYYFQASIGSCVFLAAMIFGIGGYALKRASLRELKGLSSRERLRLYGGLLFLSWVFISSIVHFQQHIGKFGLQSAFVKQTYDFLRVEGVKLPRSSVIIFEKTPFEYLFGGIGVPEMTEIATERNDLLGVDHGLYERYQQLPEFETRVHRYTMDVLTTQPEFRKVEIVDWCC